MLARALGVILSVILIFLSWPWKQNAAVYYEVSVILIIEQLMLYGWEETLEKWDLLHSSFTFYFSLFD